MVLEDTDHDGVCDSYKVFVQDKDLFAPLGIAKLGNKLYVSQSPNVWVYTIDDSGDSPKPVGKPELIFTGFGGNNHDHGVHAFVFGPDGLLYFNTGNEGNNGYIKYADGTPVTDTFGSEIGRQAKVHRGKPKGRDNLGFQEGMAFRWDPSAKKFEVVGYNFRNNYERRRRLLRHRLAVRQRRRRQPRRPHQLRHGGRQLRLSTSRAAPTGAATAANLGQTRSAALAPARPRRRAQHAPHRQGSPTGICVYEGKLLPEEIPGRAAPLPTPAPTSSAPTSLAASDQPKASMNSDEEKKPSPGTEARLQGEVVEMIKASDNWFRPSDVCVAPDGSRLRLRLVRPRRRRPRHRRPQRPAPPRPRHRLRPRASSRRKRSSTWTASPDRSRR